MLKLFSLTFDDAWRSVATGRRAVFGCAESRWELYRMLRSVGHGGIKTGPMQVSTLPPWGFDPVGRPVGPAMAPRREARRRWHVGADSD